MRLLRRGDRTFARHSAMPLLGVVFVSLVFAGTDLFATDRVWTGGTSTDWATNANWQGGTQPGSADNAVFNSTFSNQPNLATNKTIAGIWMTGSVGQNVTLSGASTLTLAGGSINGQTGLGILVDNSNTFTLTINSLLKLNNAQTWLNNSANLFTVGGAVNTNGKDLTIDGAGSTTISGLTSGTGGLIKAGTGTLILSGANTYSGGTDLNGGILQVASTETAGTSGPLGKTGTIAFGGGTLQYSSSNQFDYSGRFSTATNQAYSVDTNGQNVTWATALTSSGGSLTKLGTGTLTLSAVETYTGTTTIKNGTLKLGIASALPNTGVTITAIGTGVTATLDLNNFNETLPSLTLGGTTSTSTATVTTGTGILTLAGNVTYDATNNPAGATISGKLDLGSSTRTFTVGDSSNATTDLSVSAVISGTGGLTKAGAGTLSLSGTNTFSGTTTVNGGTLVAAGTSGSALGSTSSITVNSGGTLLLGASNQINNTAGVTLNGGTFGANGFAEGSASAVGMGALTLSANSHIDFGTGTVGLLSFSSFTANLHTLTIDNWTGTVAMAGSSNTDRLIFDSDQTVNLGFYSFTGYTGAMEIALGGGFYEIVPVVPEPRTYAAGGLTTLALVGRFRKRFWKPFRGKRRS